eukprot:191266_1
MDSEYEAFLNQMNCDSGKASATGDVDPLDAFMAGLDSGGSKKKKKKKQARRLDLEEDPREAEIEQKMSVAREHASTVLSEGTRGGKGYNSDEEVYATAKAIDRAERERMHVKEGETAELDEYEYKKDKTMKLLPPLNHDKIQYDSFKKNFYEEHSEIRDMSNADKNHVLRQLDIRTRGRAVPKPCVSFAHFGFEHALLRAVQRAGFERPTPIQSMAVPCALSGRDIIGIAKTGSGKTAAFLWPMLAHIFAQPRVRRGTGPVGMVIAPTRELAEQIYAEARRYAKGFGFRVCPLYGGMIMHEQMRALKQGVEIVVGTPGRIMDILRREGMTCQRVTYVVLDEADKMLSMGFESQVRSIMAQIRPDRQTLMFSATFPYKVEALAKDTLEDIIRINIGTIGAANKDVRQVVDVCRTEEDKWNWLITKIRDFVKIGPVLMFISTIKSAELLGGMLINNGVPASVIHGDCTQYQRQDILSKFKNGESKLLVATDVASRGLDIKGLKTVINYDCARDIDTHVHRIGRTGRAGEDGIAYTLLTERSNDFHMAPKLVRNLYDAGQPVSHDLIQMAKGKLPEETPPLNPTQSSSSSVKTSASDANQTPLGTGIFTDQMQSARLPQSETRMATDEEIARVAPSGPRRGRTMNPKRKRGKAHLDTTFLHGGMGAAQKSFRNSFVSAKSEGDAGHLFLGGDKGEILRPLRESPPPVAKNIEPNGDTKRRRTRWGPKKPGFSK